MVIEQWILPAKHWRKELSEFEVTAFWFVVGMVLMTISWGLMK